MRPKHTVKGVKHFNNNAKRKAAFEASGFSQFVEKDIKCFFLIDNPIFRKTTALAAGERQASSAALRLAGSRLSRYPAGVSAVLLHISDSTAKTGIAISFQRVKPAPARPRARRSDETNAFLGLSRKPCPKRPKRHI